MAIALLSDIHGNMDAFEAVLADIDRLAPAAVFSLGDNIGYGAEPERVVRTLRERCIPSLLGNHEWAARNRDFLEWFNPAARRSLTWTFRMLSADALETIAAMPLFRQEGEGRLVHGFPPDSPTLYLFQMSAQDKLGALRSLPGRICFVGHTHLLDLIGSDGKDLTDHPLTEGTTPLDPSRRYFVNIGSVGQPRDGDPRAKYVIWDPGAHTIEVRCVPYDAPAAAAKIIAAGLPEAHARRLLGP
ncbi:MAG: metallophosphatase family protein [Desulfobacterales bacterium]|jgi:diadenosine tetraphosphatase ApaH/serine/threonine PP2A family protein phosphatase|nr:metallophosphatase family protein [Desulfobacterales bacterium]